jgi:hypothetical protein
LGKREYNQLEPLVQPLKIQQVKSASCSTPCCLSKFSFEVAKSLGKNAIVKAFRELFQH